MVMWTNTHCFDFFSCNLIYIVSICAKLQTSSASPSILITFLKVVTYLSIMWQIVLIIPNVHQHNTKTSSYEYYQPRHICTTLLC